MKIHPSLRFDFRSWGCTEPASELFLEPITWQSLGSPFPVFVLQHPTKRYIPATGTIYLYSLKSSETQGTTNHGVWVVCRVDTGLGAKLRSFWKPVGWS